MIETARLLVRRFSPEDYTDLFEYLSEPAVYVFEPGKPISIDEAKAMSLERSRGSDFLAVELKDIKKMIGHLYFKQAEPAWLQTWELGYIFNPKYQRQGYGSEAAAALTAYGFEHFNIHRIMARCNPQNTASWKLLDKVGFKREGHFRSYGFVHADENGAPIWTDAYEYSLLRD
ncbi:MAG: GNAT family N-acetyltransferase [Anaerolineales bacterium]|nr:GNAT family N-acetyltransferase [Anaerolineales bacterium]